MVIIGTSFVKQVDTTDPNNFSNFTVTRFKTDRVWLSNVGAPENFDDVTGYINVQ